MSPSKTPVNEEGASRPASPGVEATEDMQSVVDKESIKLENMRRKSTSWKGKLTRQLSSAQLKLKNPFKEKKGPVMQSEPGTPIEHRDLSFPVGDSLTVPDQMREALSEGATAAPSEGSSSATTLSPNMDANYLAKLEQEITTSLNRLGYKDEATVEDDVIDCDADSSSADTSDDDNDPDVSAQQTKTTTIILPTAPRKRTTSQPTVKRVEFSEDSGVTAQRPSNLDLETNESSEPVRPPRAKDKAKDKRTERLLSVPNLKMTAAPLRDLRAKSARPEAGGGGGGGSKFAANFVRRFSKYQLYHNS